MAVHFCRMDKPTVQRPVGTIGAEGTPGKLAMTGGRRDDTLPMQPEALRHTGLSARTFFYR